MTTYKKIIRPNGDTVEVHTNPGASPLIFINGVLQDVGVKYRGPEGPWEPYFTWRPRRINGRWYWLSTIYRREKNIMVLPHQGYEYGDSFDMLKD